MLVFKFNNEIQDKMNGLFIPDVEGKKRLLLIALPMQERISDALEMHFHIEKYDYLIWK